MKCDISASDTGIYLTLLPLLCITTLHIISNTFQLTGKSHVFCVIIFRVVSTQHRL